MSQKSSKNRSHYYCRSGSCQRSFQHRIIDKSHYIKLNTYFSNDPKMGSVPSLFLRVCVLTVTAILGVSALRILQPDRLKDAHIASGSMAASFWGPSFRVTCGNCGFSFRCDAEREEFLPHDRRAVCPNCANGNNPLTRKNRDRFGEQVKFDPGLLHHEALDRWDAVAFQTPGKSNRIGIKRIVGLPNEWIEIRHGDIYVDGRLLRKRLAVQRKLSVLVYEAAFRPDRSPWRPVSDDSRWRPTDTGFFFDSTKDSQIEAVDWLEYHNLPTEPLALGVQRPDEAPIKDNLGYNQGISRQLNVLHDVMLSCWVRLAGAGDLALTANHGNYPVEVLISARSHSMSVKINGQVLTQMQIPLPVSLPRKVEFSLYDRQCLLAIDGRTLVNLPLPARPQREPGSCPFRIGAKDVRVWVSQLRIYRDTYYLNDRGLALPWRLTRGLGDDEYFLLGDNPPISADGRHWSPQGVDRKAMLGKVIHAIR